MSSERFAVHVGDNLPILKTLPDNSVDAIVTDPPAGISMMGKDWDSDKGGRDKWIEWMSEVAAQPDVRQCWRGSGLLGWSSHRNTQRLRENGLNTGIVKRKNRPHLTGSCLFWM